MNEKKIYLSILIVYALYLNPIIIYEYKTIFYVLIYGSAVGYIFLNLKYISGYLKKLPLQTAIPIFWIIIALILCQLSMERVIIRISMWFLLFLEKQ